MRAGKMSVNSASVEVFPRALTIPGALINQRYSRTLFHGPDFAFALSSVIRSEDDDRIVAQFHVIECGDKPLEESIHVFGNGGKASRQDGQLDMNESECSHDVS